ncbi:MAG TPA: pseudouridine synthase [Dehalococcoidia bacterium]|nr:pseudouridine synthase [Dehalococcoidia bacterium]
MPRERLQKVLARAGVASRRAAEALIAAGRVTVNGVVVDRLGSTVDPEVDAIAVDGKPITLERPRTYLLMNKPPGYLSAVRDDRGRPTVMDLLPPDVTARVYPVGRLDRDSEGLLLLTDDGELTHRLTHPRFGLEKEYLALVRGRPGPEALRRLSEGVVIDGRRTAPARVGLADDVALPRGPGESWVRIVLREGRKRQVRLMCRAVGHPVRRLLRVREGPVALGDLPPGATRPLTPEELAALRREAGLA